MSIEGKLLSILTASNSTTGEADTTLTDAVQRLVDGYGQGGGGGGCSLESGEITMAESSGNFDIVLTHHSTMPDVIAIYDTNALDTTVQRCVGALMYTRMDANFGANTFRINTSGAKARSSVAVWAGAISLMGNNILRVMSYNALTAQWYAGYTYKWYAIWFE